MNNEPYELDTRRLLCPMPVIKTQNRIRELQPGDVLIVYCTDPGVLQDIPAWCRINGHEVINTEDTSDSGKTEIIITIQINPNRE